MSPKASHNHATAHAQHTPHVPRAPRTPRNMSSVRTPATAMISNPMETMPAKSYGSCVDPEQLPEVLQSAPVLHQLNKDTRIVVQNNKRHSKHHSKGQSHSQNKISAQSQGQSLGKGKALTKANAEAKTKEQNQAQQLTLPHITYGDEQLPQNTVSIDSKLESEPNSLIVRREFEAALRHINADDMSSIQSESHPQVQPQSAADKDAAEADSVVTKAPASAKTQAQPQANNVIKEAVAATKVNHNPLLGAARVNVILHELRYHLSYLLLGLGGLAFGFICLASYIRLASQSTLVPYVVTIDSHGVVLNEGPLQTSNSAPELVITAQLCEFVRNVRTVSRDSVLQKQAVERAYAFVQQNSKMAKALSSFYQAQNPFEAAKTYEVNVEIANVISVGRNTIQVDWVEEKRSVEGSFKDDSHQRKMRALITYALADTATKDTTMLLQNPLNIYIKDFIVSDVIS